MRASSRTTKSRCFEQLIDELNFADDAGILVVDVAEWLQDKSVKLMPLAETAQILLLVPRVGPVTSTMLIGEMPELGQISGEQATAQTGLAPIDCPLPENHTKL